MGWKLSTYKEWLRFAVLNSHRCGAQDPANGRNCPAFPSALGIQYRCELPRQFLAQSTYDGTSKSLETYLKWLVSMDDKRRTFRLGVIVEAGPDRGRFSFDVHHDQENII